jgi:hypothetical protein
MTQRNVSGIKIVAVTPRGRGVATASLFGQLLAWMGKMASKRDAGPVI